MAKNNLICSIDCGSNSTRVLIIDNHGKDIYRRSTVTRLGQGIGTNNRLEKRAIERTVMVVLEYFRIASALGANKFVIGATSAVRDAVNAKEFIEAIKRAVNIEPIVLDGADEAQLTYSGATNNRPEKEYLVIDVGGGSTEFCYGFGKNLKFAASINIGCVRVNEKFLKSDPPTAEELSTAKSFVRKEIEPTINEIKRMSNRPIVIAVAGTAITLAYLAKFGKVINQELFEWKINIDSASEMFKKVIAFSSVDRERHFHLEKGRSDVFPAGALILLQTMNQLEIGSFVVSEKDILNGLCNLVDCSS